MARQFGHVDGYPPGTTFDDRDAASVARVHGPPMGGIWGTPLEGASSIVLNGGYKDDRDYGDLILYTGHGGQDGHGNQIADQDLDDTGNAALVRSELDGLPVRVIRGYRGDKKYSPTSGYRYDGLYRVARHYPKHGEDGYLVWQFRLERLPDDTPSLDVKTGGKPPAGSSKPGKRTSQTQRVVRTTAVAEWVKRHHGYECQICGLVLELPNGARYAEAAHIVPLGTPHEGPDVVENVLCLCANDHVRLDFGVIAVAADGKIVSANGPTGDLLRTKAGHSIDPAYLEQHRLQWGL